MKRNSQSDSALVGRLQELGVMESAVADLRNRRGRVVFISGEPGIGKSALAKAAANLASNENLPVYWGFSWEAGGAPAFWPWTQSLRSLIEDQQPSADVVAKLSQLLPDATNKDNGPARLKPDQARFQLLESVRQSLDQIASRQPMVLILEDLHAADSDTLQLLHYVARHVTSLPILLIGTFREIEAQASADCDSLWLAARDAVHLRPAHLSETEIREYLASHPANSGASAKQLLETTAGNPLFLTELLGLLGNQESGVASTTALPANLQQVIRQQIALLPDDTGSLLTSASVIGRVFHCSDLAALTSRTENDVQHGLEPALATGFIASTGDGHIRFAHLLHRDAIYKGLAAADRSLLHLTFSRHLQNEVAAGNKERWSELATHLLAAGPEYGKEAISAWRRSAQRAHERLAFDDAVSSLRKALTAFGNGPRFDPLERYELLIDCAEASMLAGAIDDGRKYCNDAFTIARTVEDAELMSRAALTWGGAIVVASVDKDLIAALQESLAALPENNVVSRARVQARLAAAMQPAFDPVKPMNDAREAIAMARSCNDDKVLYEVLRSANSALMDFAPVSERIALNREFEALASGFDDIPGQFRSHLRLLIDASEAGDRAMMDQSIDDCVRLAKRISLPHYQWRADSVMAMQATIDGRFAQAQALLDSAQRYADTIDNLEAKITLSLQRFTLLVEWDAEQAWALTDITDKLQDAYDSGMEGAEFYVAPFIATHTQADSQAAARRLLLNKAIIERTFAGGDRYSLGRMGELAILVGDFALAERAYDSIRDHEDECAILGLMGSSWCGPVAWSLGVIAAGLGRVEAANQHLEKALDVATSMRSPPFMSRIHASLARVAERRGDATAARQHRETASAIATDIHLRAERIVPVDEHAPSATHKSTGAVSLVNQGELWKVSYGEQSCLLKDSKGLTMLSTLLSEADVDHHVLDLGGGSSRDQHGDAGPQLDEQARTDYQARLRDLAEELEEAESLGDLGRSEELRAEIDFISGELSRAFGLGGRARQAGNAAERARVNVRRRIKDAISKIGQKLPDAGRYLENTIKTGTYCRYSPM